MRRTHSRPSHRRRPPVGRPYGRLETLEPRTLFASPTLAALPNVTLLSGAPLQIPLDGFDADAADALTFTATSNNANITPTISPAANRSLKISVSHASSGAADPAFIGDIIIKLFEDKAPKTTARIIQLAQSGFYNGLVFHRILNNFVIQGGDPLGNGTGGSGTQFDDEFNASLQMTGTGLLAMAKSSDDTNDSQFFITEGPQRHLDFNHTIFGQVVEGEAIRAKVSDVAANASGVPTLPVTMTSVTVIADKQNGVLSLSVPSNVTSGTATITVTAKDPANNTVQRTFTVTVAPDTKDDQPFLLNIPDVNTTANTPATVQLQSFDVEGSTVYYGLGGDAPNVHYTVNASGLVTVTPSNNFAGVAPLLVGVAPDPSFSGDFDSQYVPVFITPAAPTSIDLLDASDTGVSATDNVTRLNNANAGAKLQFLIGGVNAGAEVKLFDGATLIGQATVPAGATTVTLTTNGSASLSNGLHNLKATQGFVNLAYKVGNRAGTFTATSVQSAAQAITVDATAPALSGPAVYKFDKAAQSIVYTFNEDVSASLSAGDLVVTNVKTKAVIPAASILVTWAAATKQATFTFPGFTGGVLPDGNYTATVGAGDVTDAAGNGLTAGSSLDFFALMGDANHDRTVGFGDLVLVAQNYGLNGKKFTDGDLDGDGSVGFTDLVIVAQRYDSTMPAPASTPAAPLAVASAPVLAAVTASPAADDRSRKSIFSDTPVAKPVPPKPKAPARRIRR
jgi:cyclophilin family peptidyl-prolyl cis-trans isomerase